MKKVYIFNMPSEIAWFKAAMELIWRANQKILPSKHLKTLPKFSSENLQTKVPDAVH